jgi:FkbM family methyltransferase
MRIYYGYDESHYTDITDLVLQKCFVENDLFIPATEEKRAELFGDPYPGIVKHICIEDDSGQPHIFDRHTPAKIITTPNQEFDGTKGWFRAVGKTIEQPIQRLLELQKHLQLKHGDFQNEFVEQLMCMDCIDENARVLEIGGNIGRTTLIINTVLNNSKNLVTFESDPDIALRLKENLSLNGYDSHVEAGAISTRPLIQKLNSWDTKLLETSTVPDGYKLVNTTSYKDIVKKYGLSFDTLVLDCEGAFYQILYDEPEILDNIKLIIIENDFHELYQKIYIDQQFEQRGFKRVVAFRGDWGPCIDYFYEVWRR